MKSRARILVVDDEELLRKMLRSILLREGYGSVQCVPDGATALQKLKKQKFDSQSKKSDSKADNMMRRPLQ